MHHRIMLRKERESKNEIAGFGGLRPQIPAISNAAVSEKQTLAQSLRGLFTDDAIGDEPGRVGLAHFSEGNLLLALHRSMVAPAPGGETAEKSWSRGGVEP
jgi:hypothetical protein